MNQNPQVQDGHPTKDLIVLKERRWAMDLKDAYFQIPIHLASGKYLRLEFPDTVFQFRALPFEISTAPWLFISLVGVAQELFYREGLCLFQCQENWLEDAQTEEEASHRSQLLVRLCTLWGFRSTIKNPTLFPLVFQLCGDELQPVSGNGVCHREEFGQGRSGSWKPE